MNRKAWVPQVASSATHAVQHRTTHCSCPQAPPMWLGKGLQSSRPPTGASAQLQAQAPLLLRCWQWARASVHGCRDTKPSLPSPAACPCWARSKMYENTLIISFKLLRNKVILFFFYNPSKKKKFTLVQGANARPSPAEHWPLSRNACCAPAASETPRPPLQHTR